jgi:L,D-transpeptidase ErfK/SrfK
MVMDMQIKKKMFKKLCSVKMLAGLLYFASQPLASLTFALPESGDVVGEIQMTTVRRGESLSEIGRRYDVGIYEMIEANPKVDPWVPAAGSVVLIPTQFILPSAARTGIVLNLAEMRLYYYHADKPAVTTYPVGIGKKGWSTPLATTVVTGKKKDPAWVPPASIRAEHRAKGDILPAVVPGGPGNPMGRFALYLALGEYRIHGTHKPGGIGVRGSHGCVRLYPEDIESLYYTVPVGTTVRIVHEPYKIGWYKNHLYIESHQPLTEGRYVGSDSVDSLKRAIEKVISGTHTVNWTSAQMAAKAQKGYPMRID